MNQSTWKLFLATICMLSTVAHGTAVPGRAAVKVNNKCLEPMFKKKLFKKSKVNDKKRAIPGFSSPVKDSTGKGSGTKEIK